MSDASTFSKYMYETIAIGANNQLPVSSVCSAKCIFCSNNMNPFPIHREGFRSLDDIRKGIALLNPNAAEVRIGDSLPGRISEGEALLHPDILTILKMIRGKLPNNVIQVTTNGTNLTTEFIESLVPFKPMKFSISYHSDTPEFWCEIFNLDASAYKIARNSFFQLLNNGFQVKAIMVPLPNLVGYDDLENTIKNLRCYTNYIEVYPPGYSKKAGTELRKTLAVDPVVLSRFLSKMRKTYKVDINNHSDPLKPLQLSPLESMMQSYYRDYKHVLWMFSSAAYSRGKKVLAQYEPSVPNRHYAVNVKNITYGGNINAAGLLMVNDFDRALGRALKKFSKQDVEIDLVLLPKKAFDRYGDDLTSNNYLELNKKYNLPIWLR